MGGESSWTEKKEEEERLAEQKKREERERKEEEAKVQNEKQRQEKERQELAAREKQRKEAAEKERLEAEAKDAERKRPEAEAKEAERKNKSKKGVNFITEDNISFVQNDIGLNPENMAFLRNTLIKTQAHCDEQVEGEIRSSLGIVDLAMSKLGITQEVSALSASDESSTDNTDDTSSSEEETRDHLLIPSLCRAAGRSCDSQELLTSILACFTVISELQEPGQSHYYHYYWQGKLGI